MKDRIVSSSGRMERTQSYIKPNIDGKQIRNSFVRKLAKLSEQQTPITDRQRLGAVSNAILTATQVGAPQVCYFLLQLAFVSSSRQSVSINTLKSK